MDAARPLLPPELAGIRTWQRFLPVDVLLVALVYFCTARIALVFAFEKTNASPFWPPAGLALAALIILGPRALPGIFMGALGANLVTFIGNGFSSPFAISWWSLVIGLGNTLGALCGWWIAGRPRAEVGFVLDGRRALRLVLGAIAAGVLAGLVGATTVVFGTGLPSALWPVILRIWSLGDAFGILAVMPLVLFWWCAPAARARPFTWMTYVALLALALVQLTAAPGTRWPMCLMLVIPLLAIAFRSRRAIWTTANGAILVLIWQTLIGNGPLADTDETMALHNLHLLLPALALLLIVDGWWLHKPVRAADHAGLDLLFSDDIPYLPKRVIPALGITALGIAITFTTWVSLQRDQNEHIRQTAEDHAASIAGHFTARLDDLRKSMQRMGARWDDSQGLAEDLWRRNARNFNVDYGCLRALEWIDRDTVVRWIEPLAGNEAALNMRLSDDPVRRATLEQARTTHQATFTPLVTLKQGGTGFVLYIPVHRGDADDGFLVAVFHLSDYMRYLQITTHAWEDDYRVQIEQNATIQFDSSNDQVVELPNRLSGYVVEVLRERIIIRALPTHVTIAKQTSSLPALVLNAGLLLSALIGISITLVGVALTHAERSGEASQAKARFLATMSHEIRTPMNGILGAVELVLARPLDAEARKHLELVDQCGRTLLAIINDILDFSKIESGKLVLERLPLDLAEEVRQVAALLRPLAADKGLLLNTVIDPSIPPAVLGDSVRLRQVLLNLLSNALKFTERGAITLTLRVAGGTTATPLVEMVCRDTGIGMDEATRAELFTPFMQADASTTRRFGGTGLGLAIVRQIVNLWGGGTIRCDSAPGAGSTFTLTLPMPITGEPPRRSITAIEDPLQVTPSTRPPQTIQAPAKEATATSETSTSANTPPAALAPTPLRVLLAEDNPINQRIAAAMLSKCGCQVETVIDGAAAVERCAHERFAMVFMDMQMPVMDGLEACRRIRAAENGNQRVPIIALTANAFSEDEAACRAAGMDRFLSKPVRMADIQEAVARFSNRPP